MSGDFVFSRVQVELGKVSEKNVRSHILQNHHTSLYNHINSRQFDLKEISELLKELDAFIDFLHDDRNKEVLEAISQPIRVSIAKNYVSLLTKSNLKLFEITNTFVSTFNESSKKISNSLKDLVIVILSFIYQSFGREVSSFIPLIISLVLKYLKKDRINSLNLARLLTSVVRNGGSLDIDDSTTTKYLKLIKNLNQIEVQSELMNSFGVISSAKEIDLITYKSTFLSVFAVGLSSGHPLFRVNSAKALSESLNLIDYSLKDSFDIFVELYIETTNPNQQIGVIESIINFNSLKYAADFEFLNQNFGQITEQISSIFKHERFLNFSTNGKNRLFEHLNILFKSMLELTDESNQRTLLDTLFQSLDRTNQPTQNVVLVLQIIYEIFNNLTNLTSNEIERYHIILWRLSTSSENEEIRHFTVQVLKKFASKFPNILKELLDTSFNELINFSKQQSSDKIQNKTLGLSLILANLISLADKDFIPERLIQNVWEYNTNYIKSNTTLNNANFHNLITSWISVAGVFTYKGESFINSKIDEFMTIWDNLKIDEKAGKSSLVIVEYSLTALLSFLVNLPEITKPIANFFIDSLISKQTIWKVLERQDENWRPFFKAIEKRVFQIFLKLVDYIKNEKSSILIQAVHNFSNFTDFDASFGNSKDSKKSNIAKQDLLHLNEELNSDLLDSLTSKFLGYKIDELNLKFNRLVSPETSGDYSIGFPTVKTKGSIGLNAIKSWLDDSTWTQHLETALLVNPISSSFKNDYFQPLFQHDYSTYRKDSPPVSTAIVDSSIEIFAKSFSSLTPKVQLSLLETLRSHLLSKKNSEFAQLVLSLNVSVVLNGVLTVAVQESHRFDKDVGNVILETLRGIYLSQHEGSNMSRYLLVLNSESIGLLVSMTTLTEQIPLFIKRIVDEEDSNSRSFNALVLSYVYQFDSSSQFNSILEILLKLSTDAHPYVHFSALDSLATIIGKHVVINITRAVEILKLLRDCYLDDSFGIFGSGSLACFNLDFDSNLIIAKVLRNLVNSLGPSIKDLDQECQEIIKILVWGLFYNFNDAKIHVELLKLIQNIIVFDSGFVEIDKVTDILKFIISKNVLTKHIGTNLSIDIYEESNELFPLTTSDKLLNVALDLLFQLVKTTEDKSFLKELDSLVWICLELFPNSKILEKLIFEWIDTTYDIAWFGKLQKLFFDSKYTIYGDILKGYRDTLNKFKRKKVEVDVKDEEAQSIAQREDADGSKADAKSTDDFLSKTGSTKFQFKISILRFLRQLLNYTLRDSRLFQQLSNKIPDLIKISYESSTSSVLDLRLVGVELLGDIIQIYSSAKDPTYPKMSLLEQQQAQITSALIPSFQEGSTPMLASQAIKVVAMFIGSKIVPVSKLNRVGKILTSSLDDLQVDEDEYSTDGKFKINDVIGTSESGQHRIKLSILNSWAELKILAHKYQNDDNKDSELNDLVADHLDLLLPLWISSLKEFALVKHGPSDLLGTDFELFNDCWVNFVDVIGLITIESPELISDILTTNQTGFYYMMYAHCIYSLLNNSSSNVDQISILEALLKILNFKQLSEIIFHDDIYQESIEIFERLIITGSLETKVLLLQITSTLFLNSFITETFDIQADKLFEIIRVNLQPILQLVPITNDSEDGKELSPKELLVLKKSFNSIINMISRFPDIIKLDLFSTTLTILLTVFNKYEILVPHILPILKELLVELADMNAVELLNNFYQLISPKFSSMNKVNTLLTLSLLLTSTGVIRLNSRDVELFTDISVERLSNQQMANIVTHTVRHLSLNLSPQSSTVLKRLIPKLVLASTQSEDPRIYMELVILVMKHSASGQYPLMAIIVPSLLSISSSEGPLQLNEYAHKRLLMLISTVPAVFKKVVTEMLDDEQRTLTEQLVKLDPSAAAVGDPEFSNSRIKLKSFE
jgi:hypothetical protein